MTTQSMGIISISLLALAIIIIIFMEHILKEKKERAEKIKVLEDENQLLRHRYDDIHNALKDKILELKSEKSKNEKLLNKTSKRKKR